MNMSSNLEQTNLTRLEEKVFILKIVMESWKRRITIENRIFRIWAVRSVN